MIVDCEFYYAPDMGLEGVKKRCAEAGIDRAILIYYYNNKHRDQAEAFAAELARYDMFRACIWLDPAQGQDAVDTLDVAVRQWRFRGLKLMPTNQNFSCVGNAAHPLMKKARELGIPVSIHSGGHLAHPLEIGELALRFPDVPIVMDHMGYRYDVPAAITVARRSPNVCLSPTAVIEPKPIAQAVHAIGADRVMFGSNAPTVFPETQLLVIRQAGLTPDDERKVLGETCVRVFGWDSAPAGPAAPQG